MGRSTDCTLRKIHGPPTPCLPPPLYQPDTPEDAIAWSSSRNPNSRFLFQVPRETGGESWSRRGSFLPIGGMSSGPTVVGWSALWGSSDRALIRLVLHEGEML